MMSIFLFFTSFSEEPFPLGVVAGVSSIVWQCRFLSAASTTTAKVTKTTPTAACLTALAAQETVQINRIDAGSFCAQSRLFRHM